MSEAAPLGSTGEAEASAGVAGMHIGICGWNYPHWRRSFYAQVPPREWLAHCARRFTGLELNGTFFRFMRGDIVAAWRKAAPPGFRFAAKGHRFVTHGRRLADAAPLLQRMRQGLEGLGGSLGAVLWQLPHGLTRDDALLADFGAALAGWPEVRHAIEFRHDSWKDDKVAALMAEHRLAVCRSEDAEWPRWAPLTTDFVYVRLYGRVDGAPPRDLDGWADQVRRWRAEGRVVHLHFDAIGSDAAPFEAAALLERLR